MKRTILTIIGIAAAALVNAQDVKSIQLLCGRMDSDQEQKLVSALATELHDAVLEKTGHDIVTVADSAKYYESICYGHDFDYEIAMGKKGKFVLSSGGYYGAWQAVQDFKKALDKGVDFKKFKLKGKYDGSQIFPYYEGCNLRILDDNIWEYNKEELPEAWEEKGENCLDSYRAPQFAHLVESYRPDIYTMQEYSSHMDGCMAPLLEAQGLKKAYGCENGWSFTPIYYREETLELLESIYFSHGPAEFNNHDTKSCTIGVFRHRANGKVFIVANTHLWWKSESAQKGSENARANQMNRIMDTCEELIAKYPEAPVFLIGDLNAQSGKPAIKTAKARGYQEVWDIATVYGDKSRGHHNCSPTKVGVRTGGATSQIDHFFLYNNRNTEVKVFERVMFWYTVKLTDHYPNYADIVL